MAAKTSIPSFLFPRRTVLRQLNLQRIIRHASNQPSSSKPKILAKPDKFNPPSHGQKLPTRGGPRITNYGPELTQAERDAQNEKKYPNMMPPEGSFMHWFLHNKSIHVYISLGTLYSLGIFAFYHSLKDDEEFNAKYGDMLMPLNSMFLHPIKFWRSLWEVMRLRTFENSAKAKTMRLARQDDIKKRAEFRKAHGLETEGFGGWTYRGELDEKKTGRVNIGEGVLAGDAVGVVDEEARPRKTKVKKWFGIWE